MAGRMFKVPDSPGMPARKPRSTVRISFDKAHQKMVPSGVGVGKKHSFNATGKVTSMSSGDEYSGPSMEMDLSGFKPGTMPEAPTALNQTEQAPVNTLTQALKARHANRHPSSGKFIP